MRSGSPPKRFNYGSDIIDSQVEDAGDGGGDGVMMSGEGEHAQGMCERIMCHLSPKPLQSHDLQVNIRVQIFRD